MVTEQLVYFTGMTCTQSSGFGDEKLIPFFFFQFNLDGFLFVVFCFDHAYKCFCCDLCLFSSCFRCCYSFFSHIWPGIAPIYCVYSTLLLFCEHELHSASYSGVWFPLDWQS